MNAKKAIEKAQVALLVDSPFWGSLSLHLAVEESTATETMATDGKRLLFSPAFVASLPMVELVGVIAHEVSHCMFRDMETINGRDHELWNIATDYRINLILTDAGFRLPSDMLLDRQYQGMSAEAIYAKLEKEASKPKPCPWGEVKPGEKPKSGPDGQQSKPTGPNWQVAVSQAAKAAKMRGKMPGGLERLIGELIAPPRSWQEILREYVTNALRSKDDYTWSRPGRRSHGTGYYMPSMVSETLGCVAVILDTSASIGDDILNGFVAEVEMIAADTGASVELACADTRVFPCGRFEPGSPIPRKFEGFGGTDFEAGIKWADSIEDSAVTIYLTDGEGWFPRCSEKPVVWAMTGDVIAPFGKTIKIR